MTAAASTGNNCACAKDVANKVKEKKRNVADFIIVVPRQIA